MLGQLDTREHHVVVADNCVGSAMKHLYRFISAAQGNPACNSARVLRI